ncbi:MAG TPA: glycosyltransferase, partial [Chloroflexota bacterium]|nr:glycosyltransferase [Chloroflexota bacterium]
MKSELITAYVSSYPPRACGIATFTRDLSEAVATSGHNVGSRIVAINDEGASYDYPPLVRWTIDQCEPESWIEAARQINKSRVDLVSLQHEFGLYGRFERDGHFIDHVGGFLDRIERPIVTTLHTVVPQPRHDFREAVRALHDRSDAVVTMVNMARLILEQDYGLQPEKLYTIPHGVPSVKRVDPQKMKRALHLDDRTILCTFGLLSSGKGIQYVIRALPEVVKRHPEVLYLVIGETHPEVRRREGEKYRNSLLDLVHKLHLEKHVRFINQYLTTPQLV